MQSSDYQLSAHVSSLLGQVSARRGALDQSQKVYGALLSPDFGVFQFIDTSEEGISRVLAWLLDPKADHAQGERFLKAFHRWLDIGWDDIPCGSTVVQTEAPVSLPFSTRRIDVLVSSPERVIAIENKLNAPDQPNQVADYLSFLARGTAPKYCLLYLSPDGREPSKVRRRGQI